MKMYLVHISLEFTKKDNCFSKKKIYIRAPNFFLMQNVKDKVKGSL